MTRTLTLKNCSQRNSTIIENDFIDNYMTKANGEYVKVYLMLLRHLNDDNSSLSISGLADYLECTEKDVLRAFKYWTKVGLIQIDYDEAGNICGLSVGKDTSNVEKKSAPIAMTKADAKPVEIKSPTTAKSSKEVSQKELRQLYFVVEQYIGKPLSASEIKKINYFYDTLHFSVDLIEYLIEYCVENGHRTFHYIESVALNWSDAGIHTIDAAKQRTIAYTKNYYSILNAFGIKGRGPAPAELAFIKRWLEEYGFSLDMIVEACNRTIANTHKPDFKYTDTILCNWIANDVRTITDIQKLDLAYQKERELKKRTPAKPSSANRFNNFEGRSYDMDSLEQQLLNIN